MDYVFLDIEWNIWVEDQVSYKEVLQIGTSICDDSLMEKKKAFRIISPEHPEKVSNNTLKLMHLNRTVLQQAKSEAEVVRNVIRDISKDARIVVWSQETVWMMKQLLEKSGLNIRGNRFIVLNTTVRDIFRKNISVKDALTSFDIPVQEELLHCSKHDVRYLRELYLKVSELLRDHMEDTFLYVSNSKVLHIGGCHYVNRISAERLLEGDCRLMLQGYQICNCCRDHVQLPSMTFKKFERIKGVKNTNKKSYQFATPEKQFYEDEIRRMCKHFHLECSISDGLIFIKSGLGHWRIYHDYSQVKSIFHESLRKDKRMDYTSQKINHGFHEQKMKEKSLAKVLQYIAVHDKAVARGTIYKKSRVDVLLEKIGREKMKEAEVLGLCI